MADLRSPLGVIDLKSLHAEVNKRMASALEHVKHELAGVRTGRASVTILDGVHVDAYGSQIGLNPSNDGKVVRIPIPPLTDERRKELSRHVHKLTEEGRNALRQVRRDANDRLKKLLKDHQISEDDERKGLDEVQRITDNSIKQVDEAQEKKDADLL